MSMINQYLPFATSPTANAITPAAYNANGIRLIGHQPGVALSEVMNTTLRQVSVGIAALAQFAADHGDRDVLDNGAVIDFQTALESALNTLYLRPDSFTGPANQLLASNGFQLLPGGALIQWAEASYVDPMAGVVGATGTVTWPKRFPNNCLQAWTSFSGAPGSLHNVQALITSKNRDGCSFQIEEWSNAANPGTLVVLAIGF